MSDSIPKDLGDGILFYDGDSPSTVATLAKRYRFLDVLWLPDALGGLSATQIAIISRFRESRMEVDDQFGHAKYARRVVAQFLQSQRITDLIEVGCGKFPLAGDVRIQRYRAIEIDGVAINHCRERGCEIGTVVDFSHDDGVKFDAAIALYAFHFAISEDLVALLDRCLKPDGYLLFNLIVDVSVNALSTLALLSRNFPFCQIIKTGRLASREFFVVMGRPKNCKNAISATRAIQQLLS